MEGLIAVIVIVFLIVFVITYLLHHFLKSKKLFKYIPSLVSLISALVCIILARNVQAEGFKDLAYIAMFTVLSIGFISGLLSALFFDFVAPKLKRKNKTL